MSIKDLEELEKNIRERLDDFRKKNNLFFVSDFKRMLGALIPILKDQSDEIANLRQELAKKEDAVDWANPIVHERKK